MESIGQVVWHTSYHKKLIIDLEYTCFDNWCGMLFTPFFQLEAPNSVRIKALMPEWIENTSSS